MISYSSIYWIKWATKCDTVKWLKLLTYLEHPYQYTIWEFMWSQQSSLFRLMESEHFLFGKWGTHFEKLKLPICILLHLFDLLRTWRGWQVMAVILGQQNSWNWTTVEHTVPTCSSSCYIPIIFIICCPLRWRWYWATCNKELSHCSPQQSYVCDTMSPTYNSHSPVVYTLVPKKAHIKRLCLCRINY